MLWSATSTPMGYSLPSSCLRRTARKSSSTAVIGSTPWRAWVASISTKADAYVSNGQAAIVGTLSHARSAEVTVGCDPYAFVLSANLHRRHLTPAKKRELIAEVLKAKPEASNLSIAKQVKVDDKTVASVRRDLEANSEIPNKPRVEANGRKARGRKPGSTSKPTSLLAADDVSRQDDDQDDIERDRKTCVALYQKVKDADRKKAQWLADHPHAAAGLGSTIARDWDEAERAFETLTAHTVAQVAQVIPPSKAALVVEIADYFTALAAELAPRPIGNGEAAPIAGDDLLTPADLSVPGFLKRTPTGATS
jgi:hypothetical protein